jgi:hypothetical protein
MSWVITGAPWSTAAADPTTIASSLASANARSSSVTKTSSGDMDARAELTQKEPPTGARGPQQALDDEQQVAGIDVSEAIAEASPGREDSSGELLGWLGACAHDGTDRTSDRAEDRPRPSPPRAAVRHRATR